MSVVNIKSMSLRVEQFNIQPINRTATGNYAYSRGNPVIKFDFSSTNKLLDTSSLRLCYKVRVYAGDNSAPNNNQNGAGALKQIQLSQNNGASSLIHNLAITTGSGASIETIRNYPRLVSTVLQATNSYQDYNSNLTYLHGANANSKVQGRMCNLASGNKGKEYSFSVCQPLLAGFLMSGNQVNLSSRNGIGGMSIQLTLSPDVFSLWGANAKDAGGSYVELLSPSLTGKFVIPNDDRDLPTSGTIVYNSWSALYAVDMASDNTVGYNTGLGAVISQFCNSIQVPNINNYDKNSSLTPGLRRNSVGVPNQTQVWVAPVAQLSIEKGGVFYPNDFVIDSGKNAPTSSLANTQDVYLNSVFDAQRFRYFLDSIKPYRRTTHLLANGETENVLNSYGNTTKYNYGDPQVYNFGGTRDWEINGEVFGLGCRYDGIGNGNSSVNMKDSAFSERIVSKLDGTANNGLYQYFLHKASVNFSPQGVSVSV